MRTGRPTERCCLEDGENVELPIRLETTPLHFGGRRWWGVCPLVVNGQACNRRAGTIRRPPAKAEQFLATPHRPAVP
jgi:hypothetical protein